MDKIKEKLGLKMIFSFSPKRVLQNPYRIIEFYLLIYIEHNRTIEFWSNELTKTKEKIESWVHSKLILNYPINDS